MRNLFAFIAFMLACVVGAVEVSAQALDGSYVVTEGSTVTVQIGAAYQTTLSRATNVTYSWTAANSSIAILSKTSKTCTIKGVKPTDKVRLNYQCSYRYDGYARTMNFYYDITVRSNTIQVSRVEMSPERATIEVGETLLLSATAYPTNATNRSLNWTTENYSVASVDDSGLVAARGEGRVWIWARAKDGSGAGSYCVVDVTAPQKVGNIELSEEDNLHVSVDDHTVCVSGNNVDDTIYVYTINGSLIKVTTDRSFELPGSGVYIVRIGSRSFKICFFDRR